MTGRFIVVDGITGGGKSTVVRAMKEAALAQGKRVFDLHAWYGEHHRPPLFAEVADHDVFFTYEPSGAWIGAAIREEMSQTDHPYSGLELAQAFSLDRLIAYRRLILPAREAGKLIIQDRSVTSSIIIQPIMDESIALETLLELPGNAFALAHAPDILLLTDIDPSIAAERLQLRSNEKKGVFENIEILQKASERLRSDWFRKLMEEHGTELRTINTGGTMEESANLATTFILEQLAS